MSYEVGLQQWFWSKEGRVTVTVNHNCSWVSILHSCSYESTPVSQNDYFTISLDISEPRRKISISIIVFSLNRTQCY